MFPAADPPAAPALLFPPAADFLADAGGEGTCLDARMGLGLIWRAALASRPTNVLFITCRGTSLIRNNPPLGPCSRAMPRALRWS